MTYVIVRTRFFFGPQADQRDLVQDWETGRAEVYPDLKSAKARIERLDDSEYRLGHNESGSPAYRARKLDSLPEYLRACL